MRVAHFVRAACIPRECTFSACLPPTPPHPRSLEGLSEQEAEITLTVVQPLAAGLAGARQHALQLRELLLLLPPPPPQQPHHHHQHNHRARQQPQEQQSQQRQQQTCSGGGLADAGLLPAALEQASEILSKAEVRLPAEAGTSGQRGRPDKGHRGVGSVVAVIRREASRVKGALLLHLWGFWARIEHCFGG